MSTNAPPPPSSPPPLAGEDKVARVRLKVPQQLTLSVLWFSLNFQSAALLPVVVPAQISLFIQGSAGNVRQATFLGWLSAGGSLVALLSQPIIGALSDRTALALGRRRPYILVGGVLLLGGVGGLAAARGMAAFVISFLVAQLGSNMTTAAYQGLLPDRVLPEQRGTASGYLGLMTILGNVGSLALAGTWLNESGIQQGATRFYLVSGVVLLLGLGVTVVGVREFRRPSITTGVAPSVVSAVTRLFLTPWRHENFRWVFLTRAFVMLGLTLFLTFIEYYFARVAHVLNFVQSTAALAVLALGGAIVGAFTLGILSDRLGRVRLVAVATGCMTLAALTFVVAPDVPLWPLGLLFGLGYGAYTSVDWALAVDSLPELAAAGKDLGLWSIATTLPAVIAPLIGSLVIAGADAMTHQTATGYRAVFALAALCLFLGAVFVLKIREARLVVAPSLARG